MNKNFNYLDLFISKNNIEEIIVWNGRRPGQRFIIDLAKSKSIKYSSIILSQLNGKYAYRENWSNVNDIKSYGKVLLNKLEKFKKEGFDDKTKKKSELYFQRAQGKINKPESFSSRGFYTYSDELSKIEYSS